MSTGSESERPGEEEKPKQGYVIKLKRLGLDPLERSLEHPEASSNCPLSIDRRNSDPLALEPHGLRLPPEVLTPLHAQAADAQEERGQKTSDVQWVLEMRPSAQSQLEPPRSWLEPEVRPTGCEAGHQRTCG